MITQSLTGAWEFRQSGTEEWMPARVPGGVHTDLLALDRIPDPFVGDHEKHVQWVAEADWDYRYRFAATPELLQQSRIWLVCDGLDTLATVSLNGHQLGQAENMFRGYQWEVKTLLKTKNPNELRITFSSPVKYISARQNVREMISPYHSIPGGPYLRKAPCQFGWDWGPKLPSIGIWKDIRLEGYDKARLIDVHLRQEHAHDQVILKTRVTIESTGQLPLSANVRIKTPHQEILEKAASFTDQNETTIEVVIPKPELWWPNGYGEQPLYEVEVSLLRSVEHKTEYIDQRKYQMGLRTIELRQEEDQWGCSFKFLINGVQVFVKGSNWIPADSFPTRITNQHLERLICSAVETHQNMLRVWGGGFYEDERFYDLCDRYGILVWQEFIFACSSYPLDDPDFLENIHIEVMENVRRLRHRASLALWCGNNEMEWGLVDWITNNPELEPLKAIYDQFFHHLLPAWCQAEDPDHTYWPSSPSSNTPFIDPNSQQQGDCHYWDVWHKQKPFSAYRNQYPRFMSEFGFQSLPPLATIRTYADEAEWNMTSYIMEQHQKNANGNTLMVAQMLDTFRLPKDFDALVYLSMALQAEGIRYGVEHWRRHPDRIAGILYWQLNDCWPVASWSSLDYFGRWKALHYAARRFYSPVMLSIEDKSPTQAVYITNDMLEPWLGYVTWTLQTFDGNEIESGRSDVNVAPQSASQACLLDFSRSVSDDNCRNVAFVTQLWTCDNQLIGLQVAFFAPIKHLSLVDPKVSAKLHIENGQVNINLKSKSLALLVEVTLNKADVTFSDNYFSLPAGRSVRVTCALPAGWNLQQVKDAFQLRSVFDSYSHAI